MRRQDRIPFDVALYHTESSFNNRIKKKRGINGPLLLQRQILYNFRRTKCTYACRQVDLLIANQKKNNFVSIVTVQVPLLKVFSVVTKTTIQRWHTSVAHSWLDEASGRSLHKQAPPQKKTGGRWGAQKGRRLGDGKNLAQALDSGAADAASRSQDSESN